MAKKLLIVGAGGCGRETLLWARQIQEKKHLWDEIGFLDDNLNALKEFNINAKLVGTIKDYEPKENEFVVCAIGNPAIKQSICNLLLEKGAQFTNLIHPTSVVAHNASLGKGVIICPYAIITDNTILEDFVIVDSFSSIGHDVVIEKGCTISACCNVMGNTSLEEGVFIGGSAVVIPGIKIGRNATIGAGSVVVNKVKENNKVFGNPAVQIY
ncbi:acetyltransferase [Chengkuizengella sp. SCS-71B]|uniref:acetyltransferase n=1 Tax=Chengkuizengella sp. SCS-71B TaxID=3115290 RepID=UPI0032C2300E